MTWRTEVRHKGSLTRRMTGLVVAGCALALSACNTVAGAGKDVSSAGTAVTDTANDAK